MTASERLAALADDVARLTKIESAGPNARSALDVLAALPEIVAVVRAAEVVGIPGRGTELRDALAALDAKLAEQ